MDSIWVADLRVSRATADKIAGRHGLSERDIRDHVVAVAGLRFEWNDHPERGRRVLVETFIRDQRVLVVLYPRVRDAYGDSWSLGSAYPIDP